MKDGAPWYLSDDLIPACDAASRHLHLRSANLNRLTAPRADGCRAFYHAGPTVWNSLIEELQLRN